MSVSRRAAVLRREGAAASSSLDAPEPAASACRGAPQPASKTREFVIGSFKFGYQQNMMTGSSKTVAKQSANLARVCATIVEEGSCDILVACEVGGLREGFQRAGIDVRDILKKLFGSTQEEEWRG